MDNRLGSTDVTIDAPSPPAKQTRTTSDDGTFPSVHDAPAAADDPAGTAAFVSAQAVAAADSHAGSAISGSADTEPTDEARAAAAKAPLPQVNGYEILGILGRGSMGVVYKARQRALKRKVALKMILAADHASPRDLERFRAEAEAVAQLQHPNIVQIYEVGEQDGRPYFSLEYIDGESLGRKIGGTPLPPRVAAEIVGVLAEAMQYAHAQGVIHRDLKPSNVLLTRGGVAKISDFGLAKRQDDDSSKTGDGSILGTPSYMPPEQAEGRTGDVSTRSDVYALGAILYETLTGRAPFRAATVLETLDLVRTQEPAAPTELQPKTPGDLETICLKCLQKDPPKRYASAGALAEDLRRFLAGEPIRARRVSRSERLWRWCRRNPLVASLSAAVALLVVGALAGSVAFSLVLYQEQQATEQARIQADANAQRAEANLVTAVANAEAAKRNETRANQNAALAKANEDQAKINAESALTRQRAAVLHLVALSRQFHQKLRNKAASAPLEAELRPLREELLNTMRAHLIALAKEMEGTGLTSFGTAFAHQTTGDLFRDLGMGREALEQYEQACALIKAVTEKQVDEDRGRGNTALLLARIGDMALDLRGDLPRARELYREALDIQQDVETNPRNHIYKPVDHARLKAHYLFKVGEAYQQGGDPVQARKCFEECAALRRAWLKDNSNNLMALGYLAQANLWLGDVCRRVDDIPAMRAAFKEGIGHVDAILASKQHHDFKADLAESYLMYGDACYRFGEIHEARQHYEKCPPLVAAALGAEPDNLRYLGLNARMRYAQGLTAEKPDVAAERFAEALTWQQKVLAIDGQSLPRQAALIVCLARTGQHDDAIRRADALRKTAGKNPDLLVQIAGAYALCAASVTDVDQRKRLTGQALDVLRAVVNGGYQDTVFLRTHPDLRPLADSAAFQELLAKRK